MARYRARLDAARFNMGGLPDQLILDFTDVPHSIEFTPYQPEVINVTTLSHSGPFPVYSHVNQRGGTVCIIFGAEIEELVPSIKAAFMRREKVTVIASMGTILGNKVVVKYEDCFISSVKVESPTYHPMVVGMDLVWGGK